MNECTFHEINDKIIELVNSLGEIDCLEQKLMIVSKLYLNTAAQGHVGTFVNPDQNEEIVDLVHENVKMLYSNIIDLLTTDPEEILLQIERDKEIFPEYADVFDESLAEVMSLKKEFDSQYIGDE